jgi:hypothetical protein
MKTKLYLLFATLLIATLSRSQNVGIGTTTPLAQLSVGSTSQFRVNSTGNIIRINNLPYSFPTVQGTNQYLLNDGSGNLTWAPAAKPVVKAFSLGVDGTFSNWLIDNPGDYNSGSNSDPTLVLYRGFTYHFVNNAGHPFVISNAPQSGMYNVGVTNNGASSGSIIFTVPMDAPAALYYYCSAHPLTMFGNLTIQ